MTSQPFSRFLLVATFVIATLCVDRAQAQVLQFESIVDLGVFDENSADSDAQATGVNESGQISGHSIIGEGPDRYYRAFLYENGVMQNLGGLSADESSFGEAINNAGVVVGSSRQMAASFGAIFGIGQPPTSIGSGLSPGGINDNGDVVGLSFNNSQGFYRDDTGTNFVNISGSSQTSLRAVNNSGTAVGFATFDSSDNVSFTYENGVASQIGTGMSAFDINDAGQIVGRWGSEGFLYENGQFSGLGSLLIGRSINENGEIVGLANPAASVFRAGYHRNGMSMDLNSILPANSGWVLNDATGINSSGLIVGNGIFNGDRRAFALQVSIPEPGSAVVGLLFVGVALTRRRRALTSS